MKALLYAVILLALTVIHPGIMVAVGLGFLVVSRLGAGRKARITRHDDRFAPPVTVVPAPRMPTRAEALEARFGRV